MLIDLDDEHWNWINWRVWLSQQKMDQSKNPAKAQERLVINSYPLIIQAACDGLGIALGWKHLVDERLAAGSLVRPLEDVVRTGLGYFLLVPQDRAPSAEAEIFRNWIQGRHTTAL